MLKTPLLFLAISCLSVPLAAATKEPAPDVDAMRATDWRLDDVTSYRDNGLRGEVVLNGQWLRESETGPSKVLIPGGSELKSGTQVFSREFKLPPGWAKRQIKLEIGGVKGGGELCLDGRPISDFAGSRFEEYPLSLDPAVVQHKLTLKTSGKIQDDVWLRAYTQSPHSISESFIQTSYRQKSATVTMKGEGVPGTSVTARFTISDSPGGPALLSSSASGPVPDDGHWTLTPNLSWNSPKLWSRTHPNLYWYAAEIEVGGRLVDRILPRRFGFREVWIENGQIMINGVPSAGTNDSWHWKLAPGGNTNYRSTSTFLKNMKSQGFSYSPAPAVDRLIDVFDETGFMSIVNCGSMVRLNVWDPKNGLTDMTGNERQEDITRLVKRFREHPSIVAWTSGSGYSQASMHPQFAGRRTEAWRYFPLNRDAENSRKAQLIFRQTQMMVGELDPTRTVNSHNGAFTQLDTTTRYLTNNLDLQEREEFPDDWFRALPENKTAIAVSEWASPFAAEFLLRKIDFQLPQTRGILPKIHLEMAARELGEAAYLEEPEAEIASWTKTDGYSFRRSPTYQRVMSRSTEWTWRAWRTYGISAASHYILMEDGFPPSKNRTQIDYYGFIREEDPRIPGTATASAPLWPMQNKEEPWPVGTAYYRAISPVYAYIGGPDGRFITKDHLFFGGEKIRKSVIVINDLDDAVSLQGQWTAKDAVGTVLASGPLTGKVGPGQRALTEFPIEFVAPPAQARQDLTVSFQLVGDHPGVYEDSFQITIFPREQPSLPEFKGQVWMLNISDDRTHETPHFRINQENEALLRAAGLTPRLLKGLKTFQYLNNSLEGAADIDRGRQTVTEGRPQAGDLLIIPRFTVGEGKNGYDLNRHILQEMDLDKLVERGLRVLVLEQALGNVFGMQTEEVRPRHAFIAATGHPVFDGLSNSDLSYWSGASNLVQATQPLSQDDVRFPERLWNVSNTNSVASKTLIRPQSGAVRALAVSGFDLQESPLLEVTRGRGRMIFCQMDVTNRYGSDPAATKLLNNILKYLMSVPEPDPSKSNLAVPDTGAEKKLNLFHAAKPQGEAGWGVTAGELFFRESIYNNNWGVNPHLEVPVWPGQSVVRRSQNGLLETTLTPDLMSTGWGQRKVLWLRSALVVNQGGSRTDGPAFGLQGNSLALYPVRWVTDFVHPYNANVW